MNSLLPNIDSIELPDLPKTSLPSKGDYFIKEILLKPKWGKQIHNISVDQQKGKQAWDTRKIPAGSYIYTLKTKYFEKSGKLIIQ
jgi:hypothetical protein